MKIELLGEAVFTLLHLKTKMKKYIEKLSVTNIQNSYMGVYQLETNKIKNNK